MVINEKIAHDLALAYAVKNLEQENDYKKMAENYFKAYSYMSSLSDKKIRELSRLEET